MFNSNCWGDHDYVSISGLVLAGDPAGDAGGPGAPLCKEVSVATLIEMWRLTSFTHSETLDNGASAAPFQSSLTLLGNQALTLEKGAVAWSLPEEQMAAMRLEFTKFGTLAGTSEELWVAYQAAYRGCFAQLYPDCATQLSLVLDAQEACDDRLAELAVRVHLQTTASYTAFFSSEQADMVMEHVLRTAIQYNSQPLYTILQSMQAQLISLSTSETES